MDLLRIVTYNVCRFHSPVSPPGSTHNTIQLIAKSLNSLRPRPSLLCLNEVDLSQVPHALETLAQSLGEENPGKPYDVTFFGHAGGKYGNAILSCEGLKVLRVRKTKLKGGSEIITKSGKRHRIVRGALQVDFTFKSTQPQSKDSVFSVLCTHLDHICEQQRTVQLDHINELVSTPVATSLSQEESTKPNEALPPTLVVGDLNALKKDDYSKEEWNTLEKRHETNNWSSPTSGCLDSLTSQGFVDLHHHFHTASQKQHSTLATLSSTEKFTAHGLYRIDYVMAQNAFLNHFEVSNAFVFDECDHSDHFPVIVDLKRKAAKL